MVELERSERLRHLHDHWDHTKTVHLTNSTTSLKKTSFSAKCEERSTARCAAPQRCFALYEQNKHTDKVLTNHTVKAAMSAGQTSDWEQCTRAVIKGQQLEDACFFFLPQQCAQHVQSEV